LSYVIYLIIKKSATVFVGLPKILDPTCITTFEDIVRTQLQSFPKSFHFQEDPEHRRAVYLVQAIVKTPLHIVPDDSAHTQLLESFVVGQDGAMGNPK
jgi:hypothetical protein